MQRIHDQGDCVLLHSSHLTCRPGQTVKPLLLYDQRYRPEPLCTSLTIAAVNA